MEAIVVWTALITAAVLGALTGSNNFVIWVNAALAAGTAFIAILVYCGRGDQGGGTYIIGFFLIVAFGAGYILSRIPWDKVIQIG